MKYPILAIVLCLTACSTISPTTLKDEASAATALAIKQLGLDAKTKSYLYTIADTLNHLSGGSLPDVATLTSALNLSISDSNSATLNAVVAVLSQLYADQVYSKASGNTATALLDLQAIAAGVEEQAAL